MTAERNDRAVFDRDVVERVLAHMNVCHREENLLLVRVLGNSAHARAAWIAGFDGDGVDYLAESQDGPLAVRLRFRWPAATLAEVSDEMLRLYRLACRAT